jgi:hypothetical protein
LLSQELANDGNPLHVRSVAGIALKNSLVARVNLIPGLTAWIGHWKKRSLGHALDSNRWEYKISSQGFGIKTTQLIIVVTSNVAF